MFLLDSNTVINYLDASLPATAMLFMHNVVDENCNISIITKMETLGYHFASIAEQQTVESFITDTTVMQINDDIVSKTIAIRKQYKIKLPDAIIAATALVYGLHLITRNITDFKNIEGVITVNPYEM